LSENTRTKWEFEPSLDEDVRTIEAGDPRSTFFRYPTLDNLNADAVKSTMKEFGHDEFKALFSNSDVEPQKLFVVENEQGDFVRGYRYDYRAGTPLSEALRRLATTCDGIHVAIRVELCGGW
jgi:hypothetical protein